MNNRRENENLFKSQLLIVRHTATVATKSYMKFVQR